MSHLPINSKEAQVIQFLFDHSDQYISSQMVGEHINVSDRTARKYINNLRKFLMDYGAEIETKKGHGFRIQVNKESEFNQLLEEIHVDRLNLKDVFSITEAKDRERYILNKIFLENQYFTSEEYADELFVSRSTILHGLQNIRDLFSKYELTLNNSVNDGISVTGPELEKRRFILNYFFDSEQINSFMDFNYEQLGEMGISIETLFVIVLEECRNAQIQISDYVMQNLVLHLALAIIRIKAGKTIEAFRSNQDLKFSHEVVIANRIVRRIEETASIVFPNDEAKYIALHLKSKSNQTTTDIIPATASELRSQIITVLSEMNASSNVKFKMDAMLLQGLEAHFEPLVTRLEMGIPLKNPLYEEVYGKYERIFNETKRYFKEMPVLSNYQVDDHEWAYITLHILASVERFRQSQQLKVMVVCSTGMGSAQMLRNRLENEFGRSITIVDVISYYQLNDQQLCDIDLIISTIDISVSFFTVPVVRVSVFLNEQDIKKIKHFIKDQNHSHIKINKQFIAENHAKRLFETYFNEDRFMIVDEALTREELLKQMIIRLTDCHGDQFVKEFIKHIELREQFGSLAFSETVAFPHPSIPLGTHSEVVIALVPGGLEWNEEHSNVQFVILMSPSKISNKGLRQITDYFVDLVASEEEQAKLLAERSFEAFKENFIKKHIENKENQL